MKRTIVALMTCGGLAGFGLSAGQGPGTDDKAAFESLKALAGSWQATADGPEHLAGTVTYHLTAGGSGVIETLMAGTPHEMVSVFYLDGPDLVLNHYCSAGNQPHMRLDRQASRPGHLVFAFAGGLMPSRFYWK